MKKTLLFTALICIFATICCISCTNDDDSSTPKHSYDDLIIGTWTLTSTVPSQDLPSTWEFASNGICMLGGQNSCTYGITGNTIIVTDGYFSIHATITNLTARNMSWDVQDEYDSRYYFEKKR